MKIIPSIVGKSLAVLSVVLLLFATVTFSAKAQSRRQDRAKPRVQTARVLITEKGYSRTSIDLRRGVLTRITFLRQTDATCATEIVIPVYGINRSLPLDTPTIVSFTPKQSGDVNFSCGMNMMRGKLIVR
ncbi:MAG TPA: cupredoxin domain-containing protein [Pyrinomonadaceae bacterium]|jgi:plastocyanin domain-containing protein|nr:cupredoxin domain-containing protein [Pyrinomonadaceae bacterium]